MSNEEIINELREEIINLRNCTDDPQMIARLYKILNGDIVSRCKCPNCGNKFDPREEMKHAFRILSHENLNNK